MPYNFSVNEQANSVLVVDIEAIVSNYKALRTKVIGADCAATLKANAYGLGIEKIALALNEAGCSTFFVATIDEAIELRKILNSDRKQILVLNGFPKGTSPIFKRYNLMPVLNDFMQLERWIEFNKTLEKKQKAALHLDTGMNRLGLDEKDFARLIQTPQILKNANVHIIISHLSCSDESENKMNNRQLLEFTSSIKLFPKVSASIANSGGIFLGKEFYLDLVRPGLALYGSVPGHSKNELVHAVSLYGRVLQIRTVRKGELIGYGGSYKATRNTNIATIGVGYADGYQRSLSGNSRIFFLGSPLPLVGRISMDSITVDISDLQTTKLNVGDFVELLGKNFTIDQAASLAQTVPYELLTGLGRRHYKHYHSTRY